MRGMFKNAVEALHKRLDLVLCGECLSLVGEPVKEPTVTIGFPAKRPNFLVWVDPMPRSSSTGIGATNHEARSEFSLSVFFIAVHSDRERAINLVSRWIECAYAGVLADATLCRAVDSAIPRLGECGYDETPDKKTLVAAEMEVRFSTFSLCPSEIREFVNEHRDM